MVVDPLHPDRAAIRQAAALIRQGGVVVFPTLGLYGLGVDPFNAQAVARIFALKRRDASKPLLVLLAHPAMTARVARPATPMARRLMAHFWPGRVTFVLSARPDLSDNLTAGSGKIGVRQAAHPVAAALAQAVGGLIIGTSANISGGAACAAVADLDPAVRAAVDGVLDAGLLSGAPSTVVDVTGTAPVILRQGAVPAEQILAWNERFV